jgi:uncharacterized membrane protein
MSVQDFFREEEKKQITTAIGKAELNTSGEIRLHVERKCPEDVLDRAAYWFGQLAMHKTEMRNGVLFYLAVDDHKFAILGDAGINAKVPKDFWEVIKAHMFSKFKEGRFADGLSEGIMMAGEQLKAHFPYQKDDVNELSDEISFGKK